MNRTYPHLLSASALRVMMVFLCCACAASDSNTRMLGDAGMVNKGAGGDSKTNLVAPMCPASNLTRPCMCDDGSSGSEVCIEQFGWQGCNCGNSTSDTNTGLNLGDNTPAANNDVAVTFDDFVMPMTVDPNSCKPGNYQGTFACAYTLDGSTSADAATPGAVNGVVSFALTKSANSETLEIKDGLLDGWGIEFFFAYLNGNLDCGTGELMGTASEGFYNPILKGCSGMTNDMPGVNCVITDKSDPNYAPWTVNLEGSYSGTLDTTTDTITGNWQLMPIDIGGTCNGTFTVTYTP